MGRRLRLMVITGLSLLLVLGGEILPWRSQALPLPHPVNPAQSWLAQAASASDEDNDEEPTPSPPAKAKAGKADPAAAYNQHLAGLERSQGLFNLYRDRTSGKLFLEIKPEQLNVNYLCTTTLESGVGEMGLYSGMPLMDFIFQLRQVNNRIQFVVPNVYFRASEGSPVMPSIEKGFSDSVLQSIAIKATHPKTKQILIELNGLLLNSFLGITPGLSDQLRGSYSLDSSKSYFGPAKAFANNVELESVYGFSGSGRGDDLLFTALPDNRSFNLRVRYSLSDLPQHNYQPRLADERIGYFISAYQDLGDQSRRRLPYVRYINRWNLVKQDPTAAISPPVKPITFWIENTVPEVYREPIRQGILMWNRAFEAAGFENAIAVQQMPKDARWDPADVNYNVIRWMSSYDSWFVGMGPSRVNPLTGEILDADILIDGNVARSLQQDYRSLVEQRQQKWSQKLAHPGPLGQLCGMTSLDYMPEPLAPRTSGNPLPESVVQPSGQDSPWKRNLVGQYDLCYGFQASRQLALGAMNLSMLHNELPNGEAMQRYVNEFIQNLVAHEVGHTLGLRHNFRGSAMLSPDQLNNREITRKKGLSGSVMDYNAVNLAPAGQAQGEFFGTVVGPYDVWAIEYGYRPSSATSPESEQGFLEAIAQRAAEPDLAYSTDEDTFLELDPKIRPFDLSSDGLVYAETQFANAARMWGKLESRYPLRGESFSDLRQMFNDIFGHYVGFARSLPSYIGGQAFNRYRSGDSQRTPLEPLGLEQQRRALKLIQTHVLSDRPFQFAPSLLNKLVPSRWYTWGETPSAGLDYPLTRRVEILQAQVLMNLLSGSRLSRLQQAEYTNPTQALTIPELFTTVQDGIWQPVLKPDDNNAEGRKLALSAMTRNLQRLHLELMGILVLNGNGGPDDARTVAAYHLKQLRTDLDKALRRKSMNTYTKAHLQDSRDRITKLLKAGPIAD
jgi:Met-zincin/Domain of unknown function (DUF5117)